MTRRTSRHGRGAGRYARQEYFLYDKHDVSFLTLRLRGRHATLHERHQALYQLAWHCHLRHAPLWWYPERLPHTGEYVLYIQVSNDSDERAWTNVRSQAKRLGVSCEKAPLLPPPSIVKPVLPETIFGPRETWPVHHTPPGWRRRGRYAPSTPQQRSDEEQGQEQENDNDEEEGDQIAS